jgi:hypothetical protein
MRQGNGSEIYDAFHLEVRYHTRGNEVFLRIAIDGEAAPALVRARTRSLSTVSLGLSSVGLARRASR